MFKNRPDYYRKNVLLMFLDENYHTLQPLYVNFHFDIFIDLFIVK